MTSNPDPEGARKRGAQKLGQLLIERGRVSGELLMRAILGQRTTGGRLGTCLLELEAIEEDQLVEALAEQQGAPAVRAESLRSIPEEIVRLIPARVAVRCSAVPFAATDKVVDVAMVDVKDLKVLDELAFCTSRRIRAHVASEVRIQEALAKYYGAESSRRFSRLADRLNRQRYLWKEEGAKPSEAAGSDPWDLPSLEVQWTDPEDAFESPRRREGSRKRLAENGTRPK